MAKLLLLDTATAVCNVGLLVDGRLYQRSIPEAFKHAEQLTVLIAEVVAEAGISYGAVQAVAVTGGPGSYTGLRIGASVAKGICYATQASLIALNTLDVMVEGYRQAHPQLAVDSLLVPMLDARRMEVYTQAVQAVGGHKRLAPGALVLEPDSFSNFTDSTLHFFGDGALKYQTLFAGRATFSGENFLTLPALAHLAESSFSLAKFESIAYYRPDYHKEFYTPRIK